jgi:hypothetical protein
MAIGQLLSRCLYFHVSHRDRKRSIRKGTTGGSRFSRSQNCSERGSMEVRARFPLLLRLHRWECGPVSCIMRRQSTSKPMPRWRLYSSAVNTALAFSLTRNISTRIDLCRPFGHGCCKRCCRLVRRVRLEKWNGGVDGTRCQPPLKLRLLQHRVTSSRGLPDFEATACCTASA